MSLDRYFSRRSAPHRAWRVLVVVLVMWSWWVPSGALLAAPPEFDPGLETSIHVYDYTPGGTAFWNPFTATDSDGDTLTYSLTGTDASSFSIDSATGQLSVGRNTKLDADTKSAYSFNVVVHDDDNSPPDTLAVTLEVRKCYSGLGIWCGTVLAGFDVPDVNWYGYGLARTNVPPLFGNDFGSLVPRPHISIPGTEYLITFMADAHSATNSDLRLRLEPSPNSTQRTALESYAFRVQKGSTWRLLPFKDYWNDVSNHYEWRGFGINWTGSTHNVSVISLAPQFAEESRTINVYRNAYAGTSFGEPVAASYHGDGTLIYTLEDQAGGRDARLFEVDSATGQLRVGPGTDLDEHPVSSYDFDLVATDPDSNESGRIAITVNALDCPHLWCATLSAETSSNTSGFNLSGGQGKLLPSAQLGVGGDIYTFTRLTHQPSPFIVPSVVLSVDPLPSGRPTPFYGHELRVGSHSLVLPAGLTDPTNGWGWEESEIGAFEIDADTDYEVALVLPPPIRFRASIPDQSLTEGGWIAVMLPEAHDGAYPITYELSPLLPSGLSFDAAARRISGTLYTTQAATEYFYRATDVYGETAEISFDIEVRPGKPKAVPPAIPVAPTVTASSTSSVRVTWNAPDYRGSPITDYDVQYRMAGANDWTDHAHSGRATSTTIGRLEAGTIYYVQVRATNGNGSSDWSLSGMGATRDDKDVGTGGGGSGGGGSGGGTGGSGSQVSGLRVCPTETAPFTDVDVSSFAAAAINCIYGLGITTGTTPSTYSPEESVTRAQMAVFLARLWEAAGRQCPTGAAPFTDVDAMSFAAAAINCIYGLGVTIGTTATTFGPDDLVTRAQMAVFLVRLWEAMGQQCPAGSTPFTDVGSAMWAQEEINCLYRLGITIGTTATTFGPDDLVTRAQMAVFLVRLWQK